MAKLVHLPTEILLDILATKGILAAAQALKIFRGYDSFGLDMMPSHRSNLTELHLMHTSIEAETANEIMTQFESLTSFTYQANNGTPGVQVEATPSDICRALLIRRDTLRRISLAFYYSYTKYTPTERIMNLKDMAVLEILVMDGTTISLRDDFDHDDGGHEPIVDEALLINTLPPSITTLGRNDPWRRVEDSTIRLIQERALFPNLRKVHLQYHHHREMLRQDAIRDACDENGFEFGCLGIKEEADMEAFKMYRGPSRI